MTIEVFRQDPYVFEFEADVVSVDGDDVVLNATAFYPGGGGQVCDTGTLNGRFVKEVFRKGDDIIHIVPENDLKPGNKVWGSVDWDRRYDLMIGHTAEHLLFGSLQRFAQDISIVKIFISTDSKYVVIDRDIEWDCIGSALNFANDAIMRNLTVRRTLMDRNDPDMANVRVDLDKVATEEVSVTEIGNIDRAACSGIHVMETGEIGALFVDRKVSAGKDGVAIHFRTGWDAIRSSMELGLRCIRMSDAMNSKPEDAVKAAINLKEQADSLRKSVSILISNAVASLPGKDVNGTTVFSGEFPAADSKVFTEAAERHAADGNVCILVSVGDNATAFVSSGTDRVDASAILKDALEGFGGRGGGKRTMAQGAVPNAADSGKLMERLLETTEKRLVA